MGELPTGMLVTSFHKKCMVVRRKLYLDQGEEDERLDRAEKNCWLVVSLVGASATIVDTLGSMARFTLSDHSTDHSLDACS